MKLSTFQLDVLGRTADDYESPGTIVGDMSRELGREVSINEIQDALSALGELGFVQAYKYHGSTEKYEKVNLKKPNSETDLLFLASPAGKSAYGKHTA